MAMGLRIGHDVKLAGFDDDPIATFLPVPLTTVRLPARPFAEAAFAEVTTDVDEQGSSTQRQIIIDCELAVRASTAS
jgi:DNA-binding LacI/PurR family transcriptional regulator